jgi:hypothetical protein
VAVVAVVHHEYLETNVKVVAVVVQLDKMVVHTVEALLLDMAVHSLLEVQQVQAATAAPMDRLVLHYKVVEFLSPTMV